jgi:hypothetical protein
MLVQTLPQWVARHLQDEVFLAAESFAWNEHEVRTRNSIVESSLPGLEFPLSQENFLRRDAVP